MEFKEKIDQAFDKLKNIKTDEELGKFYDTNKDIFDVDFKTFKRIYHENLTCIDDID